jgi:pantetheine-phosphate adenylyltransferase
MNFDNWTEKFFNGAGVTAGKLKKAYQTLTRDNSALYAISADPPTWGHADIMMRASKKFSRVIWAIAQNPDKSYLFSIEEKKQMMQIYIDHYKLDNVEIMIVTGSTARFAKDENISFLIRGLRSSSDYQMEFELSVGNRGIAKKIETICMFSKPHYATISSSIVRQIALLDEEISQYVHSEVAKIIKEKISSLK